MTVVLIRFLRSVHVKVNLYFLWVYTLHTVQPKSFVPDTWISFRGSGGLLLDNLFLINTWKDVRSPDSSKDRISSSPY